MNLPRKYRWLWLLAAVAAVAVVAFWACKDDEGKEGETPTGGERIDGGTLTVACVEGDKLDPHQSSFATEISFERMLWRGPYTLDKGDIPQPAMAAELPDISDDGLTYTITLRDGLLWSDGDDLKAEDFVLGILRTCNPDVAGEYQYVLSNVVGCDDYYAAYGTEDEPKAPTAG